MTSTGPANIVAIDQENRGIVAVVNNGPIGAIDREDFVARLPAGGGLVVGDSNVWSVRNPFSVSQYCWPTMEDRNDFVDELSAFGYTALVIENKLANDLQRGAKLPAAEAVRALCAYVHDRVAVHGPAPEVSALRCGCANHGRRFDSGHKVRESRGDKSFGQRRIAALAFMRLQNTGGYTSPFAEDVIAAAWEALDPDGRDFFKMLKRKAAMSSPSKLMAIAVCTHDPRTGQLRTHEGQPWGANFIVRHVIGLNGNMRGVGANTAGNPMRAVLRIRGMRAAGRRLPVDPQARRELDRHVRDLIRVLQAHGPVRPAGDDWPERELAPGCPSCGGPSSPF